MDLTTFEDGLDRWGGDVATWPRESRAGALALLETSAPARRALAAVVEVEAVLRSSSLVAQAETGAIAVSAMRHPQLRPASRFKVQALRAGWATAAAAVLFLGVFLGQSSPTGDDGPDRVLAIAFDSNGAVDVD